MKRLIPACALVAAMAVAAHAQDKKVKSDTKVEVDDDATVVSLTGCLRQDTVGHFSLVGTTAAAGEAVRTKTRVETDVDDDDVEVEARTRSRATDDPVGTSGALKTYVVVPRGNLALAPHVGHHVQLSAVMLHPDEDDAKITVRDKTTVDPDDGPSRTQRSKTKVEVENAPHGQYTVVSVKPLGTRCSF